MAPFLLHSGLCWNFTLSEKCFLTTSLQEPRCAVLHVSMSPALHFSSLNLSLLTVILHLSSLSQLSGSCLSSGNGSVLSIALYPESRLGAQIQWLLISTCWSKVWTLVMDIELYLNYKFYASKMDNYSFTTGRKIYFLCLEIRISDCFSILCKSILIILCHNFINLSFNLLMKEKSQKIKLKNAAK